MKVTPGTEVGITYDGEPLRPGDVLVTTTGRMYGVVSVRRPDDKPRRQYLRCVVLDELPSPGTRVLPLIWYSRGPKQ